MSQALEALKSANRIRLARTKLKREIKAEEISVAEVLTDEIPDWLENMPIGELLGAIKRFPLRNFHSLLAECPISEMQPVGRATIRQRNFLADAVLSWEAGRDEVRERRARRAEREKVAA